MSTIKDYSREQAYDLAMLEIAMGLRRLVLASTGETVDQLKLTHDLDGNLKIEATLIGKPKYRHRKESYENEARVLSFLKSTGMDTSTREIIAQVYPDKDYQRMITPVGGTLYRLWQQGLITKTGNKRDRKWCYNFGAIKLNLKY